MTDDDKAKLQEDEKPDADAAFAATLRNLVNTPHKPHKPSDPKTAAKSRPDG